MTGQGATRRLTAILAADLVGYSRLMGEDEAGTLAELRAVQQEIVDPVIVEHGGRIVKLTGDGILAEFPSVVEATRSAMAWQRRMAARNESAPEGRRLVFRIGVNLGDVLAQDDDIFGDGVNVAARLEAMAEPGGICLSSSAYEQVVRKLRLRAEDLGELQLKNIAEPVRAYRIDANPIAEGAVTPVPRKKAVALWSWKGLAIMGLSVLVAVLGVLLALPGDETPPSFSADDVTVPAIAVLPFDNLSGDPEQEYFVDGMSEDLITDLSRVSGLFVIARNSTFTYKGRAVKVQQVAEELGVDYVVEGSVRRIGERVRINAQLVDARSGHHLWAERFDREITNVFLLQDEVVRRIVSSLAVELTGKEQEELSTADDVDPEAYDLLLRGLERFRRFTRETNAEAREFFARAAGIDPTYARAHADVALSYAMDLAFDWSTDHEATASKAMKHATAALALNDKVHQVHFAVGNVMLYRKKHDEALEAAKKAIELDPSYADSHAFLGLAYNYSGDPEKGLASVRLALRLNPRAPFFYIFIEGQSLYQLGKLAEAIARFERVRDGNPAFLVAHQFLAAAHQLSGDGESAEWAVQEALAIQPRLTLAALGESTAYKHADDLDRFIGALREAGMPE
jgi:TolB-like protein/class 3 adenylate cyclase